ncbi:hypothetical protein KEM52_000951 [Ascosphaera acerosa]|nr:hypothetical protein KEM52_000951 [Ascosphaera acerosa]
MALPQLCKHIVLTSYDRIRFRDNMSEGCGSASPFSMGLNAIVSRNLGPLVRSFTLRGSWAETELEEHSRLGRVPESSMMLNIAVRAALNEMTNLEFFAWQLNTKALDTVYRGLAQASKLKALTIRFPSSRHPRPTTSIPPMPQLESLKVTDIDPLCYPDDISALVAYSPKLNDLKLHWSPRIKRSQEPSVRLSEYFRKCVTRGKPLRLRSVSFQNFYAPYSDEIDNAFDMTCLEEMHILDSPGIFTTDYVPVSFVETSWANPNCFHKHNLKCLRHDHLDKKVAWMISRISALEQLWGGPDAGRRPSTTTTTTTPGAAVLTREDLRHLRALARAVTLTPEMSGYVYDISVFLRMSRGVAGGATPAATTHVKKYARCLAPLQGCDFVFPSLVAIAVRQVYRHRLVTGSPRNDRSLLYNSSLRAVEAAYRDITAEGVIEEVLERVTVPV